METLLRSSPAINFHQFLSNPLPVERLGRSNGARATLSSGLIKLTQRNESTGGVTHRNRNAALKETFISSSSPTSQKGYEISRINGGKNHARSVRYLLLRIALTREDLHFIAPYVTYAHARARARRKKGPTTDMHVSRCAGKRVANTRGTRTEMKRNLLAKNSADLPGTFLKLFRFGLPPRT